MGILVNLDIKSPNSPKYRKRQRKLIPTTKPLISVRKY